MKSPLSDFSNNQRRLRAGFAGGGHGTPFADIHRAAMRISDRYETVSGAFSSDPENSVRAGAALTVAPDRVHPDHTEMTAGKASRDDGIVVTPNHRHFEPFRLILEADFRFNYDKSRVNRSDETRALIELMARTDASSAVTCICTGHPMVSDARKQIHAGEVRAVRFMHVRFLLGWPVDYPSKPGKGGVWRVDPAEAMRCLARNLA